MTTTAVALPGWGGHSLPALLGMLLLAGVVPAARGEPPEALPPVSVEPDLKRAPIIPPGAVLAPPPGPSASASGSAPRIRLFRIQPGFVSDIPWLDQEEPSPSPELRGPDSDPEERITVNVGNDNPYFDFRRRGDPGGVGFTRLNTQVGLFDTGRTACALAVQAVTPSGQEFDGLPDRLGPTVLMPALSIFHALDDGLAVQAFVGKNMPVMNASTQPVSRDLQYGVAVQRPLLPDVLGNLIVSLGAVGQHRLVKDTRTPVSWEVLPGLHYQVTDSWWISGGLSLPVGPAKTEPGQLWQVTCSLQF